MMALILLEQGHVKQAGGTRYLVRSQRGDDVYVVELCGSCDRCSCPDAVYRGHRCKHYIAAAFAYFADKGG